jgi:hypothetical protein
VRRFQVFIFHCESDCDTSFTRILSAYGRTADDISDSMVIKCASTSSCAPVDLPLLIFNRCSHVSPFLFTRTLLPVMNKTSSEPGSDVRIVNVCEVVMGDGVPQLTRTGILGGAPVGTESAV